MKHKKENQIFDSRSAILCEHIVKGGRPILRAIRDEPLEDADSGWQFLCNTEKFENEDNAQIWAISEVLEMEPSLSNLLGSPPGTELIRNNHNEMWKIIKFSNDIS